MLWILFLLPPLWISLLAKESFREPKLLLSEWLGLASLLPLAFRLRAIDRVGGHELWRVRALVAVVPLVLVATLSLATTHHPAHVREGVADLWIGAACLVGWSAGLPRPRLSRLLAGLLVPATALALLGLLQFHGVQPLRFEGPARAGRLAITSLAGNPGDLAAYLVLPCLLAAWFGLREWQGRRRGTVLTASAVAWVVCLYALTATETISAFAAVGLGTLVLGAAFTPRRLLAPSAVGALVLGTLLILGVAPLRSRVVEKARQLAHGDWNSVLTGRLDGWRAALWMAGEHPLTGVGQGAFETEFVPAKLALLGRGAKFYTETIEATFANAHSEPLNLTAELGLPGLLALGWGLWILGRALRQLGATADRREAALAWAGAAGLAILALFQFPFRIALVSFPALLFLAWVFQGAEGEEEP
ncbi:MAG TPA: O-antigen ligase family protein [Thermoanaerobaculia bacterium]|nr:O-antigen ligase family protein [Thermoanaerobaculia bacterium]